MEKVNSELLAMTYGAIVTQIIKDYKARHTHTHTHSHTLTASALTDSLRHSVPPLLSGRFSGRGGGERRAGEDVSARLPAPPAPSTDCPPPPSDLLFFPLSIALSGGTTSAFDWWTSSCVALLV